MTRIYECQVCGLTGSDKEQFNLVKVRNVKMVYCTECVELLKRRLKAERRLNDAHKDLVLAPTGEEWVKAHDNYKIAFSEASRLRHLQNVREYKLDQ